MRAPRPLRHDGRAYGGMNLFQPLLPIGPSWGDACCATISAERCSSQESWSRSIYPATSHCGRGRS